jgi:hypothetical protein
MTKKQKTRKAPKKDKPRPKSSKPQKARSARISDEDLRRHRLTSALDRLQESVGRDEIQGFVIITVATDPNNDGAQFVPGELPLSRVQYLLAIAERYNMDRAMQASRQSS